jgi:glycosyltransferase involved in cell wall biosynthesis
MSTGTRSTLVSVMIPTYNQKQYLEAAIESALAQTYPYLEIIVSDDASPDPQVAKILNRYARLPNVTVYRNETNLGRVANYRTTLYERTNGEWVVNLDGDDYFHDPSFIEKAMALVVEHPGLVMVSCRCLEESGPERKLIKNDTPFSWDKVMAPEQAYQALGDENYYCCHPTTIYRRETALALDFYRYDITAADSESLLRLMACGDLGTIPVWGAVWRNHGGNASLNLTVEQMVDNLKAVKAPRTMCSNPLSKVPAAFWKQWFNRYFYNKARRPARELVKSRHNWRDYFIYLSAVIRISPRVGLKILLRPKNLLRLMRAPFINVYTRVTQKTS